MIDDKTKNRFLQELEKSGNVYLSCLKMGINRATYYRWKNGDKEFKRKASWAERNGRQNNCDIAEHALMINVKEKKMEAIKYVLSHYSPVYKPKNRKILIEHSNTLKEEEIRLSREKNEKIDREIARFNKLQEDICKIIDKEELEKNKEELE